MVEITEIIEALNGIEGVIRVVGFIIAIELTALIISLGVRK